jgi:hypothetical protein
MSVAAMPSSRHERLDADDVHDAREVVGQHVQRHLGGNPRRRVMLVLAQVSSIKICVCRKTLSGDDFGFAR